MSIQLWSFSKQPWNICVCTSFSCWNQMKRQNYNLSNHLLNLGWSFYMSAMGAWPYDILSSRDGWIKNVQAIVLYHVQSESLAHFQNPDCLETRRFPSQMLDFFTLPKNFFLNFVIKFFLLLFTFDTKFVSKVLILWKLITHTW